MSVPPASTVTISTPSAANPNDCAFRLLRLAVNSVAATTSTVDKATCTTMSALKAAPPAARLRPLDDRVSRRSTRPASHAGATPMPSPASVDAARVNSSTFLSGWTCRSVESPTPGRKPTSTSTAQDATSTPSTPPAIAMRSVSDSSWRANRRRLAPSARRTERSRCRAAARARNKVLRFAHASTNRTATMASIACTGLPYRSRNSGRPDDEGASSRRLKDCARARSDSRVSAATYC